MVGEEHLRRDGAGSLYQLVDSHRVGLVARQESDVDVLQVGHLRDVLCVASNVDAQSVEGEDIAVVASLWVELGVALGVVIGWHGLDGDVLTVGDAVAVFQREAVTEHVVHGCIGVGRCGRRAEAGDGLAFEVVLMLMGDEDDIGLWELVVVCDWCDTGTHGVDLDLRTVIIDFETGVLDARDSYFLAALGGKLVYLLGSVATGGCQAAEQDSENVSSHFYYGCYLINRLDGHRLSGG